METVSCPVTGCREFTPWTDAPDRFNLSAPPWKLVRAKDSGLVMLNPRPDATESSRHYPAESYDPFIARESCRSFRDKAYLLLSEALLGLKARIVMKGVEHETRPIRVLDVGCSTGRLLKRLNTSFGIPIANLCGLEPDHGAATAAKQSGLVNIDETDISASRFTGTFDRIVFWHSLEHLHNLEQTLGKADELLSDKGMLVIALPNIDSDDAIRYGRNWIALDAPRHLYHFTPETLGRLLGRYGFTVHELESFLPDALYNTWYSEKLACSVENRKFGMSGILRASTAAVRSIATGLDPRKSSGFICRALRTSG